MRQKILKILPYIVILILLAILMANCESKKVAENALKASQAQTKHFKNELGTITAQVEVMQLEKRDLKKQVIEKDLMLKKLSKKFTEIRYVTKTEIRTKIDSVFIPFDVVAPCTFSRPFKDENKFYNISGLATDKGVKIDSINVNSNIAVITGTQRKWLFGKIENVTEVSTDNPNVTIGEVKTVEGVKAKRWYDSTIFKIGVGFFAGFILNN